MNNQLETFSFHSQELRIEADNNGEPLFHANDLCTILGYTNPREALSKHVDTEDVTKRDTLTAGGKQQVNFVCEAGMWSLIMRSNASNAKPVQRWVTSEVLPNIRKHGAYIGENTEFAELQTLLRSTNNPMPLAQLEKLRGKIHSRLDKIVDDVPMVITAKQLRDYSQPQTQTVLPDLEKPLIAKTKPTSKQQFEVLLAQHLDILKAKGANNGAIKSSRSQYRKEFRETGIINPTLYGEETRGRQTTLSDEIAKRFKQLILQSADQSNPETYIQKSQRTIRLLCEILKGEFKQGIKLSALYHYVRINPELKQYMPKMKGGM